MRTLLALALFTTSSALASEPGEAVEAAQTVEAVQTVSVTDSRPERGVIFHLSHGKKQAHHVIHPLVRAARMSSNGMSVLVYLDVDAAPMAFDGARSVTYEDHDSGDLLRQIVENGGTVAVCGQCAAAAEKTPDDLIDGAIVATAATFFDVGQQIITFDY